MLEASRPIRKTLRPDRASSVDWENTENIYIEGDNLDALKLLQESYLGKVKMIYIDPPYNKGKDFIYRDNFTQDKESYDEEIGIRDEEENKLFQNTESNGRFHSDWCSMIYPRLKLARNLLSVDGVIFISIEDNEVDNLRKICDEVFGRDNFVTTIHCQLSTTQGMKVKAAQDGNIVKNAEYVLCYTKGGHKNIALHQVLYDLRPNYNEHYSLFLKDDGSWFTPYEYCMSDAKDSKYYLDLKNKYPDIDIDTLVARARKQGP